MQNDNLRDACREWSQASLDLITRLDGFARTETDTWIRVDDRRFERITWNRLIYKYQAAFATMALPQFTDMVRAVEANPKLGPLWGQYVGLWPGPG